MEKLEDDDAADQLAAASFYLRTAELDFVPVHSWSSDKERMALWKKASQCGKLTFWAD